jgi:hypothetical protein
VLPTATFVHDELLLQTHAMRRPRATTLAMKVGAFLLAALVALDCHHDAEPAHPEPTETPPLPPASGTPIGFLIDGAYDLKLTDDQIDRLREIDVSLAAQLEVVENQTRVARKPPSEQSSAPNGGMRGGGMRGGGMRGGGMGGMGGGPRGATGGNAGRHRSSGQAGSGSNPQYAPSGGALNEEQARDVRDAIQRALALLNPTQQEAAKKLLEDRGVDLSAKRPAATPAGADGSGGVAPVEP